MLISYAANEQWELPTGCSVQMKAECPEGSRVVHKSHPEASSSS